MSEQDNLATLNRALAAINSNDIDAASTAVHPDIRYIIRGKTVISGTYHGIEAISKALRRLMELTGGTIMATPEVVMAQGDHIMMYLRVTGTRPDGRSYDNYNAYLYRFEDGRLIEGQTIPVDQAEFAAFLAD